MQEHEGLQVVRGDLYPGGLKCSALTDILFEEISNDEVAYAGCYYGHSSYALGLAALLSGKRVRLFMPAPQQNTYIFSQIQSLTNVKIEIVAGQHQDTVQEEAREYACAAGAYLLPIGLDSEQFRRRYIGVMHRAMHNLARVPRAIWTSAGSGVTARCLQEAFPSARVHVVDLGVRKSPLVGSPASLWSIPERLSEPARTPPPWPSASYYDAKIWQVLRLHAKPGDLVWNIA